MKKTILIVILLALIGLAFWLWGRRAQAPVAPATPATRNAETTDSTSAVEVPAPVAMPAAPTPPVKKETPSTPPPAPAKAIVTPEAKTVQVVISGFAFAPSPLTVKKGTTVVWMNKDTATHTVSADSGLFDSGALINGNTFSFTFTKAGTYPYVCGFHPGMRGVVEVTD